MARTIQWRRYHYELKRFAQLIALTTLSVVISSLSLACVSQIVNHLKFIAPTRCVLTEPLRTIWTLVKTKRTYDRNRRAQSKLEFHRCLNHKTEKPAVSYAVTANGMILDSRCSSGATEILIATTCYAATCTAYRGYRTCRVEQTCPIKKKVKQKW